MEFRYRAIDVDRPPPTTDTAPIQPPNPTFSFLSARPVPGPSEVHVREAIQREIEKEQIRQEIIIAEAARKRELIAEVLQEMAIEREMAITGMSLEDKLTMWINQRKLPNQNNNNNNLFRHKSTYIDPLMYTGSYNSLVTSPMIQLPPLQQMPKATGASIMESNKETLIVLNRADRADPIGEKRKAEETQTGLERAKRIADRKEASLKAKPMSVETGDIVSSKIPHMGKRGSGKQVKSKLRSSFKFWCEICKVGAFNQTVMRNHELGKKHKAAITQHNEPPEAASTSFAPASVTEPQSEAITVLEDANPQGRKVDEMSVKETTGKKTEGEEKKKVTFWCKTCDIWTNSEQMMETHRLGKKHKGLLKKQQNKPQAVLDTKLITVPVISLNTDSGDKESVDLTKGKVHCLNKS